MWEMLDVNNKPREFNSKFSNNKPCGLCKSFFRTNDKFYIIIIPVAFRGCHKRLKENMFVHIDEWNELCKGVTTDEELVEKIISTKFVKNNKLSDNENKNLEAFEKACFEYGFRIKTSKAYGCKMRKHNTSICLEYNVYRDCISINYRGKRGLFDSFYQKQIVTNVYNKMHEILADGKHDNYDYKESISQVFKEVNDNIKNIFN